MPDALPRLPAHEATRAITLPLTLAWSGQRRELDLAVRADRIAAYRAVLQYGTPDDILSVVDGELLADAWPDLLLPPVLEPHWQRLIERQRGR